MKQEDIKYLLEMLSERPVLFHPFYARTFGGVNEALLLQQLIFWGDKGERSDGFIYKTKDQIEEETTLTPKQQDRARNCLIKEGILEVKKMRVYGAPTLHYKVDIRKVHLVIREKYKKDVSSISENTTKKAFARANAPHTINREEKEKINRVIKYFKKECERIITIKPLTGVKGWAVVKNALTKGELTEVQAIDLVDEWFGNGKPDDEIVQITRAFSNNQVNGYKARNL